MDNMFDKPIFVTGVPRSGTSMVAGALSACGAWVGKTWAGTRDNPKGFFEHVELRERVIKELLAELKCDTLGVRVLPDLDQLQAVPSLPEVIHRIIVNGGYEGNNPWLLKDAKLTLIWPIFVAAFPDARWIVVRRAREDIVRSCLNTVFMAQHSTDPGFWHRFVEDYENRINRLLDSVSFVREIWPEQLVCGNLEPLRKLVDDLDLGWNEPSIKAFITQEYWHARKRHV
jgi:hypothetical protein